MTAAVFGLIGVLVGSIGAGLIQWAFQRRAERAEIRAALRLLMSDFYTAQALIRPVRASGSWGPELTELPLGAFDDYRRVLAANLDFHSWKQIEGSVLGIRHLRGIRAEAETQVRAYTSEELAHFERIGEWLDVTITGLQPLVE